MSISSVSANTPPTIQQEISCSGQHKARLLVGEGNFSFALALINKHDEKAGHTSGQSLGRSIVATELKSEIRCNDCEFLSEFSDLGFEDSPNTNQNPILCESCETTAGKIEQLKEKGVEVILGIDGTKLSDYSQLKNRYFSRIHWNCPHDGSQFKNQTLPTILKAFFQSCSALQMKKGQVHVALAQPAGKKSFYQGFIYNIVEAASASGYSLIKKRKFGPLRYPGYQHTQTNKNQKASVTDSGVREFVFQKVLGKLERGLPSAKKLALLSDKNYQVKSGQFYQQRREYFECSSDEDSSDYEE